MERGNAGNDACNSNKYRDGAGGARVRVVKIVEPRVVKTDPAHFRSVVHSLTGQHFLPTTSFSPASSNCSTSLRPHDDSTDSPTSSSCATLPAPPSSASPSSQSRVSAQLPNIHDTNTILSDVFNDDDLTLFAPLGDPKAEER
ncbi:hypothetical protein GOP47_0020542 [Adiantum capillus-veneris]|uniref:VQ domain-containing protein n=1 Tax=Adiantum capillus-veneris TaxID=13818 RepID=A0A9D4U9Q0_ADICA|nr:hypothetical protein GOP47_0020542 [Adiantum capillus-veneris]